MAKGYFTADKNGSACPEDADDSAELALSTVGDGFDFSAGRSIDSERKS